MNKDKPTIEKIEFTPEEQENINALLEDRPTKETIERQKSRGVNIELWLKHRAGSSQRNRNHKLKQYYGGFCHICQGLPLFKVSYDKDDATLVQYYCDQHFKESGITECL